MRRFLGFKLEDEEAPFSLLDFLIQWIVRVAGASLFIHEMAHLVGANLINLYAEIRSTNITAAYPDLNALPLPFLNHIIFYGMGGFIQAIIFLAMNIKNDDRENRMINTMVAVHGIIYGIFEAGFSNAMWGIGGLIASIAGFVVFFGWLLWKKPEIVGWI